jgi:hypothetical protein
MQDCFGMEVDVNFFRWKYIANPDGFVRGYFAKSSSNEIAAYYGVIPQTISYFGENKLIFQSCDTMTHSKHRRKGLFQRLALHCYKELSQENKLFIIGFGGSESTPGFLKFGWKHLFNCKNYFYPSFLTYLPTFDKKSKINKLEINELNQIEHLFNSNNSSSIYTLRTTEKYIWRFSNPNHAYKTLTLKSTNQLITSYIIYYIEQQVIQLIDYSFETKSEARQLVKHVIQKEKKTHPIKGVLVFCQENGLWIKFLKKIGFMSNPFSKGPLAYKTPFINITNQEELAKISDKKNWNISPFDHDSL